MTTAELLQKAEALAREGWIQDAKWCSDKVASLKAGEGRAVITENFVQAYQDERDSIVLDGTAATLARARETQQLLVATRNQARLYREAVCMLTEELEMAVLLAEHSRAAAARKEAHA